MLFNAISIVSLNLSIFSLFLSVTAKALLVNVKNEEDKISINKDNINTKNLYCNKDKLEVWLLFKVIFLDTKILWMLSFYLLTNIFIKNTIIEE